jgi:predicted metal-dependent peptidase
MAPKTTAQPGNTPAKHLAAARMLVRQRAPYFTTAILRFRFVEVEKALRDLPPPFGLPTAGMSAGGTFYYNPDFILSLSLADLAGVILHETLHFVRNDAKKFPTCKAPDLAVLANIACDCANNDDLVEAKWSLPGRPLTEEEFKEDAHVEGIFWVPASVGEKNGRTAEVYFEALRKRPHKPCKTRSTFGTCSQCKDDGSPRQESACGGVAGNPHPNEEKFAPGSGAGNEKPKDAPEDGGGEMSEQEQERLRAAVAKAVQSHVKQNGRGSAPSDLSRWADEKLQPPRIPWQQKLARAARRAVAKAAGAQDYSFGKPSRRQAGVGHGPGRPRLPALHGYTPSIAVVIDTSGSMGSGQLAEAMSETAGILRTCHAGVTFCAIDCRLGDVKKVKTWQEAARNLKGGGGTDMAPAFKALREQRDPPSIVVCITDGMIGNPGPSPEPQMKVIWVLVGSRYLNDVKAFGEVIVVDDLKKEAA